MFTAENVLRVVDSLTQRGIRVWLDGGWGVDALLGSQHRAHEDLDVVVALVDVDSVISTLEELGYRTAEDHLPTRLVLRARDGPQVDVHPVTFDEHGTGWQAGAGPRGGDCAYPASGFTSGAVAGTPVGCLTPDLQVAHHDGYEPTDTDREDLDRLHRRFGVALPQRSGAPGA
jgi:lincosamide nucleotidyltransferase A/C/D/E